MPAWLSFLMKEGTQAFVQHRGEVLAQQVYRNTWRHRPTNRRVADGQQRVDKGLRHLRGIEIFKVDRHSSVQIGQWFANGEISTIAQGELPLDTMTISDVSRLLHITDDTARNRLSAGLAMPPSFRVGRRRLFLRTEVEKWMSERAGAVFGQRAASFDQHDRGDGGGA